MADTMRGGRPLFCPESTLRPAVGCIMMAGPQYAPINPIPIGRREVGREAVTIARVIWQAKIKQRSYIK